MDNGAKNKYFSIDVIRDKDSNVYVGTSEDIPGLTLETGTLGELFEAAMEVVPQLLEYNLNISRDNLMNVTINVHLSGSQPQPSDRCRYIFEQEAAIA